MGGCWGELSSMKEMLKEHGFKYFTDTVASSNKVINGGTAIGTSSFLDHKKSFLTVLTVIYPVLAFVGGNWPLLQ